MTQYPTKIYIAGHLGMVGAAIVRRLLGGGVKESQLVVRTHAELDLTNQVAVNEFFATEKPSEVYLAAAKVGGIHTKSVHLELAGEHEFSWLGIYKWGYHSNNSFNEEK